MCYDVSFQVNFKTFEDYFPDLVYDEQISIDFDAAVHIVGHTYGKQPIIYINREDQKPHCRLMEWGVIPFYIKDEAQFVRQRASMLNARSERILDDKTSYWYKIRNRRCLVPVSGIFEHRGIKGWKHKVPYYVSLPGEPLFFLPGLYSVTELPDKTTGELIKRFSYTIVTRAANGMMKTIHNDGENRWRMPLFLPVDLAKQWLDEDTTEEGLREILNYEIPSEKLTAWPVFTIRTTKERPDGKSKLDPYEWDKLPPLGVGDPEPKAV